MNILDKIEKQQIEKVLAERQIPDFSAGDTLKVNVRLSRAQENEFRLLKEFVLQERMLA